MLETGSKLSVEITIIYTPKKTIIYITILIRSGSFFFLIKNKSKYIYNVTKKLIISHKCCSFDFPLIKEWLIKWHFKQHKLFSILIIINVPWAVHQHIRIISEGSCVTKDVLVKETCQWKEGQPANWCQVHWCMWRAKASPSGLITQKSYCSLNCWKM